MSTNNTKTRCRPGERYDKLTVIEAVSSNDKYQRGFLRCRCDCGNEVTRRAEVVRRNKTNNCGCSPRGRWRGVGGLSKTLFYRLKYDAELRSYEFEVSMEYLWDLFQKQDGRCAISGLPIELTQTKKQQHDRTASVDRIDNAKGYIVGNVHWVHRDINQMKHTFALSRFVELCKAVAAVNVVI